METDETMQEDYCQEETTQKETTQEENAVVTLLTDTRKMIESLTEQNAKLSSELKSVKEVNLRLAKSMPAAAADAETFESALADMFDLKKGGVKND